MISQHPTHHERRNIAPAGLRGSGASFVDRAHSVVRQFGNQQHDEDVRHDRDADIDHGYQHRGALHQRRIANGYCLDQTLPIPG